MPSRSRPASLDDLHEVARSLPGVKLGEARGRLAPTVYQVSGRSFIFFRNPRPDAVHPESGERYTDVIVFWVDSELEKDAIMADASLPFITTPHFDQHSRLIGGWKKACEASDNGSRISGGR